MQRYVGHAKSRQTLKLVAVPLQLPSCAWPAVEIGNGNGYLSARCRRISPATDGIYDSTGLMHATTKHQHHESARRGSRRREEG